MQNPNRLPLTPRQTESAQTEAQLLKALGMRPRATRARVELMRRRMAAADQARRSRKP